MEEEKKSGRMDLKIWPSLKKKLEAQTKLDRLSSVSWLVCELILDALPRWRQRSKEIRKARKVIGQAGPAKGGTEKRRRRAWKKSGGRRGNK